MKAHGSSSLPPLVLDLDGTVIRTDTFHEMMVYLLVHKPWVLLFLPFWFLKGRAYAKARLTDESILSPEYLPYNLPLLSFAREEGQRGRLIILATGTDQRVAKQIADHLGFFHDVIASNGIINMTGVHKRQALLEYLKEKRFDYAGDSRIDAHIWEISQKALVVHPKRGVINMVQTLKKPEEIEHFPREKSRFLAFLSALRPLFWLTNFLTSSISLFMALGFLSSGLLLLGDLLSLNKERKRSNLKSVFAEGHLHLITAFILSPFLVLLGWLTMVISHPGESFSLLLYAILFIGIDLSTRHLRPSLRWSFLVLFQLVVLITFKWI